MATIYDLQAGAGTVHRELSFDVDGRFARLEGLSLVQREDGVTQLVVSLSLKAEEAAAVPEGTVETAEEVGFA